jgi:hypothetical protein
MTVLQNPIFQRRGAIAAGVLALCVGAAAVGYFYRSWDLADIGPASVAFGTLALKSKAGGLAADNNTLGAAPLPKGVGAAKREWLLSDELLYSLWELSPPRPVKPRDKPLTPAVWRIVGQTTVGSTSSLLILLEGSNVPVTLAVGAELPSGEKIVAVDDDYVTLLAQGKRLYLPLGR